MSDITQPDDANILHGNYRIIKLLNDDEGFFAKVYLAQHTRLHNLLAIKEERATLRGKQDKEKFIQEAQLVAALTHPNIVRVMDYNTKDDGTPYIVMDYAPQGSLRKKHPKGTKLPLSTIIAYVKQIANALQYAHDKRVVHRDIKPENMLLGPNNEVLLSDFGLAVVIASTHYDVHHAAGTAFYMAPEQFAGQARPNSDQYGLAAVVYEWLCGAPPFTEGNFIQLGYQHTHLPRPPLVEPFSSKLPKVEQVIHKALAQKAEDRFSSVKEFAEALEEAYLLPDEAYYSRDAREAIQAIRDIYYQEGYIVNLGMPKDITPEIARLYRSPLGNTGYLYPFENGVICWSKRGGTHPIWWGFAELFNNFGGIEEKIGFPLTDELSTINSPQGTAGVFQRFEGWWPYPEDVHTPPVRCGTSFYYSQKHGPHPTWGAIGVCYERIGGTSSQLGFPISHELDITSSDNTFLGRYQRFEGGSIYWDRSKPGAAYPIWGAIGHRYDKLGGAAGRLGFPTSAEIDIMSEEHKLLGKLQHFDGGTIYWNRSKPNNAYAVWGGIARCYEKLEGAKGVLGFPTSSEIKVDEPSSKEEKKRWYQHFEGGDIYYCRFGDTYDGILVVGEILNVFKQFDGCKGRFGFPKSPEKEVEGHPELHMQEFEGGVICIVREQVKRTSAIEKTIYAGELMQNLEAVLDDIDTNNVVYFVYFGMNEQFVLVPLSIGSQVLGLVDPEYGWPTEVKTEHIQSVEDIAPGVHRHPFILRDGSCIGVGIQISEYIDIKNKERKTSRFWG